MRKFRGGYQKLEAGQPTCVKTCACVFLVLFTLNHFTDFVANSSCEVSEIKNQCIKVKLTIIQFILTHWLTVELISLLVSYFDWAEKLAAANIAASTSTLSWESRLWRILWWAFFLSGMMEAKLPSILIWISNKMS